jgi:aspartate/methionine/tyrosine aminotransferase
MPDLDDLRMKCKYNDSIAGILLINPDNPTGAVYSKEMLEGIVAIAREFKLFVIADEIYIHIVYNGQRGIHLSEVIGDVPGIAMRGISKEFPWPGSRCGWIEILNRKADPMFDTYVNSLLAAKRLEVCSTTIPQMAIPLILGNEKYSAHLRKRADIFNQRAKQAYKALSSIPGESQLPQRCIYMTVLFEDGVLNNRRTLKIANPPLKSRGLVAALPTTMVRLLPMAPPEFASCPRGFCKRKVTLRFLECDNAKELDVRNSRQALREYLASLNRPACLAVTCEWG